MTVHPILPEPSIQSCADDIGYNVLGPFVHRYLLGLHQHICQLDDGDTKFLLCARAGVRIGQLYKLFLTGRGGAQSVSRPELFWISRLAVCKGIMRRSPSLACDVITAEYAGQTLFDIAAGLLQHRPDARRTLTPELANIKADAFPTWIKGSHPNAQLLRHYLNETSTAFEDYLSDLVGDHSRIALIDSGWKATTQRLLSQSYPEADWIGLYLGVTPPPKDAHLVTSDAIGIMFEASEFDPKQPETAIIHYRHLIETLFEPNAPSIEEPLAGLFQAQTQKTVALNLRDPADPQSDTLYLAVTRYIADNAAATLPDILAAHADALPTLCRVILQPTRAEALALQGKNRSADFGKKLNVPVLIDPKQSPLTRDQRVSRTLWTAGQIALEFPPTEAQRAQQTALQKWTPEQYFDPRGHGSDDASAQSAPSVAIITRTKNRPLMLRRAAQSVVGQTYPNYRWIVVNDGGPADEANAIIAASGVDLRRVTLINNAASVGMEAASNLGIAASSTDYIVIHDDDDTVAPTFLEEMVSFLQSRKGQRYEGAICRSTYVSEEIVDDTIIERHQTPYMDWVQNVSLAQMACSNFFAPISFVFRRTQWERIGGYNEDLPVLGDWQFNLEFLLQADIGIVNKPLAFYHHRDTGHAAAGSSYANSVSAGWSKHAEFASVVRNQLFRDNADNALGAALLSAQHLGELHTKVNTLSQEVHALTDHTSPKEHAYCEYDRTWLICCINAATQGAAPFDPHSTTLEKICAELDTHINGVTPPPNFDVQQYVTTHKDVADAITANSVPNAYFHYIKFGMAEGRPRPNRTP
ncbi:MAG: glycosyltransferase [Pseudomonadota bacterium]